MLMDPAHLASAYVDLHEQKPTVWSHEIQLTPSGESIGMRL